MVTGGGGVFVGVGLASWSWRAGGLLVQEGPLRGSRPRHDESTCPGRAFRIRQTDRQTDRESDNAQQ